MVRHPPRAVGGVARTPAPGRFANRTYGGVGWLIRGVAGCVYGWGRAPLLRASLSFGSCHIEERDDHHPAVDGRSAGIVDAGLVSGYGAWVRTNR